MFIRVLAVCGLLLFLGSIGLGLYLRYYLAISASNAAALRHSFTSPPQQIGCFGCLPPSNSHALNLSISNSTITTDQTDALTADFAYPFLGNVQNVPMTITLIAPEFTFTPEIAERTLSLSVEVTEGWVLNPTKPGTFKVGVQVEVPLFEITDVQYVGITVTNTFGLIPWQIQLLSYLGTFLGPLLTAAWWYDKWQERKRKKSDEASLARTMKSPKPHRGARQKR
jgi:hypothetical protein